MEVVFWLQTCSMFRTGQQNGASQLLLLQAWQQNIVCMVISDLPCCIHLVPTLRVYCLLVHLLLSNLLNLDIVSKRPVYIICSPSTIAWIPYDLWEFANTTAEPMTTNRLPRLFMVE
jgi:hypothetical protein